MAKSKAQHGSSGTAVLLSLLAQIDTTNRKPKCRFLLGLGEQFETNFWDISDSEDDEKNFLMASQVVEKKLSELNHSHQIGWGPLNHLLNSISFVKTASRESCRG